MVAGRYDPGLGVADAVTLGAVEGATEFLPVSSTGHLIVARRLLDLDSDPEARRATDAYVIALQGGALVAVAVLYRRRLVAIGRGLIGRDAPGRRLGSQLLIAFMPSAVVGLAAGAWIKAHLFTPPPVAVALVAGGVAIVAVGNARTRRLVVDIADVSTVHAALIGAAQVVALWPGTSRSLVTILAALAAGLSMSAAVEFSFLLGVVTLGAASAFELVVDGDEIARTLGVAIPLLGAGVAAIAAGLAVKTFVAYLERRTLTVFATYRIVAGLIVAAAATAGLL